MNPSIPAHAILVATLVLAGLFAPHDADGAEAAVTAAAATGARELPESGPASRMLPVDRLGRPVLDDQGHRIRHPRMPAPTGSAAASVPAIPSANPGTGAPLGAQRASRGVPAFFPGGPPPFPASASSRATWSYSLLGSSIGLAGLDVLRIDGHTDILVGGRSDSQFGQDDFWQVLRREADGTNYVTVYSHPVYRSTLVRLLLADVAGDLTPEIIVALEDGTVEVRDGRTRDLLQAHHFDAGLTALAVANLDGSGRPEWIVATQNTLSVHRPDGSRWWRLRGPGGTDVAVGQCDADASLEIVTASGHVINAASRAVQWEVADTFGTQIQLGDLDRDGRDDIVASIPWLEVRAYKVGRREPLWTLPNVADAIQLLDLDGNPGLELLLGEDQWGEIQAYRGQDGALLWTLPNPNHGVTRLLVADLDQDGRRELAWGTGASTTGADELHVHDLLTLAHEWTSLHLDGPFLGPIAADFDGDGRLDLVTATESSESGYSNGRLLVFDALDKSLRAMSGPLGGTPGVPGVRDLRARDIDGDGRPEIVTAPNSVYDGVAEIYRLTTNSTLVRTWVSTNHLFGMPFDQADVVDVDGDGELELVALNAIAHSGATGYYLYVYDLATQALEWRATNALTGYVRGLRMAVEDLDGDGTIEVAMLATNAGVRVFHPKTKTIDPLVTGPFTALHAPAPGHGLWLGTTNGTVTHYAYTNTALVPDASWVAGEGRVTDIRLVDPERIWVTSGGAAILWATNQTPLWRSEPASLADGSPGVATWTGLHGLEMVASSLTSVRAFRPQAQSNLFVVSVQATANGNEAGSAALLRFSRDRATAESLDITFSLSGSAIANTDYTVEGASPLGPEWTVRIAEGVTDATVRIYPVFDQVTEGTETVIATIESSNNYIAGAQRTAIAELGDTVTKVRVFTSKGSGSEGRIDGRVNPVVFSVFRLGPLQPPLVARFNLAGTAENGVDYRARVGAVEFKPNESYAYVTLTPVDDGIGEPPESVTIELQPGPEYIIEPGFESAAGEILDNDPTIAVGNYEIPTGKTNAAAYVSLHRSHGDNTRPITAHYLLSRQIAGEPRTAQMGEIRFLPNQEEVRVTIPAGRRQHQVSEFIRLEVLSHPSYVRFIGHVIEFNIPATNPP